MTVITIQTNDDYGYKLFRKLKADKHLKKVTIEGSSATTKKKSLLDVQAILPGPPLEDAELLDLLSKAAHGKSLTLDQARKKTAAKIALWRNSTQK